MEEEIRFEDDFFDNQLAATAAMRMAIPLQSHPISLNTRAMMKAKKKVL
jgi:hypothetical protein